MTLAGSQARPARRHAELALRVVLTAAAAFFFYRTALNFRAAITPPPDDEELFQSRRWNQDALDRSARIPAPASLPWPRYPGAVVQGSSVRGGSSSPFAVQDLSATGSAEEIIRYYRAAMKRRGWEDMSDATFGISQETATGQVASQVGLQQEQFLRSFDGLRSSVLMLGKKDRRVMISVEDGEQTWKKRVRLASFPERPMDALASTLDGEPVRGRRGMRIFPHLTKTDRYGVDEFKTQILTSTREAPEFYRQLAKDLERQGWVRKDRPPLPAGSMQADAQVGLYTRGTDGTLVVVTPVKGKDSSVASVTRIVGESPGLDVRETD
jgi:hypothetical protein